MKRETISPVVLALMQARANLEENWCQGCGQGGQVCAVEAWWNQRIGVDAHEIGMCFLTEALPFPRQSIIAFNDDKRTTKADILALYDRAIALALNDER